MAEENQQQVQQEPQQVQGVTTKNLKKVEVGKRLGAHNRRKREELKVQVQTESGVKSELNQCYSIGDVITVGVIGGLGYYIYRTKKGRLQGPSSGEVSNNPPKQLPGRAIWPPRAQTNKFEMD